MAGEQQFGCGEGYSRFFCPPRAWVTHCTVYNVPGAMCKLNHRISGHYTLVGLTLRSPSRQTQREKDLYTLGLQPFGLKEALTASEVNGMAMP